MHELLSFSNSLPKNLGAAYTRANTVFQTMDNVQQNRGLMY
jgi:hypothetical protein